MWGPDVHKTSWQSALLQVGLLLFCPFYEISQLTLFFFFLFLFFLQLCTAFGLVGAVSYVLIKNRPERPATARDYPYSGLEKELGGVNVARKEQVDEE